MMNKTLLKTPPKKKYNDLPVQVESMIEAVTDKTDNIHRRSNYYTRLMDIRDAVTDALAEYDKEMAEIEAARAARK